MHCPECKIANTWTIASTNLSTFEYW